MLSYADLPPLKPITPWAVLSWAFQGAIPPMIGVVAVDGKFSLLQELCS